MFTLGCTNLVVAVDHKPLLGILNDRDLGNINNPRLQNIKQHTLKWNFSIVHIPGKLHVGPDAVSRNPSSVSHLDIVPDTDILTLLRQHDNEYEMEDYTPSILCLDTEQNNDCFNISANEYAQSIGIRSLHSVSPERMSITLSDIHTAGQDDPIY